MEKSNSFWQGFASALTLTPQAPEEDLIVTFRGYNVVTITAEDALRLDWQNLGDDFKCSVRKITEHGKLPQPASPPGRVHSSR
jgi:hypothetical protein